MPDSITEIAHDIFSRCVSLISVDTSEQVFAKFKYDDQYLIISNFARQYFARQYNTNNIYTKKEINQYKNFIILTKDKLLSILTVNLQLEQQKGRAVYRRKSNEQVIEEFIKTYVLSIIQNKPLLYFMCYNMDNAFTVNELDWLIKISCEIGEIEITTLLLEYKNNHIGYIDPLDEFNLDDHKTK